MSNSTVAALPAASALDGTELYYGVQSGTDTKVTGAQIKTWCSSSPTLVTPNIGVAIGTSLALGGATLGGNALAVTGTALFNSAVTYTAGTLPTASNQGTISSGTFTPAAANSNYQYYTNNGAHTLAAPAADSAIDILVTNGASAGTITFSGFTVGSNTGDSLTTTNTNKFIISVRRINAVSAYQVTALQ